MRRAEPKRSFKLQMLALVLALVLIWYSLNPAPGPVRSYRPEEELPDEKRREVEPQILSAGAVPKADARPLAGPEISSAFNDDDEMDDFEWPDIIDA